MRLIKFTFLLSMVFIFLGCSDDKDETFKDDLVGSCWHQDINEFQSYTFYFALENKCTVQWNTGIGDPVSTIRKYEYRHPNITISLVGGSGVYATGYIEDETMYLELDSKAFELKRVR